MKTTTKELVLAQVYGMNLMSDKVYNWLYDLVGSDTTLQDDMEIIQGTEQIKKHLFVVCDNQDGTVTASDGLDYAFLVQDSWIEECHGYHTMTDGDWVTI